MKKILSLALVLLAVMAAFGISVKTTYPNTETGALAPNHSPADIVVLDLYKKSTVATKDTFLTTDIHVSGPFPLSSSMKTGMFSGFQVVADAITGTSPTMALDFQVLPSASLADTSAWTSTDTLSSTATNQYQSLSSFAGKYIVFRVNNYDNTQSEIPGNLRIIFKENWTFPNEK